MSTLAIDTTDTTDATRGLLGSDVMAGVRAMAPWLLGVAPYGLVIGVTVARTNIPTLAGWLTGPAIYSGSAQVATINMLGGGAAPVVVVVTALAINLRLVLYSGAIAPHWRTMPRWWRLVGAYLLVDPSFAVGVDAYQQTDERAAHARYFGGAVALWVTWLATITLGITVGTQMPAWLHLEFVVPLFLVGEVVPRLTGRAMWRATVVAVAVAVLADAMPWHVGLAVAMAAGIAAGVTTDDTGDAHATTAETGTAGATAEAGR
jgi:predicted branched-subunit amino acid permease